jgi:hypothetical protein
MITIGPTTASTQLSQTFSLSDLSGNLKRDQDMTTHPIELTRLDTATFEHLVNSLAIRVLGMGVTGFAPGADGGRDGYFEGEAEYPSSVERWNGIWYLQSKFRTPSLSGNPQTWLQQQVKDELKEFSRSGSGRVVPNNWIIATNIDPSATPNKGTFDKIRASVAAFNPELAKRTHIWGGKKILDLLVIHGEIARHYGGLLTSGDVIAKIINSISDSSAGIDAILRHFIVTQLSEQQYTRLEQAGSSSDTRPGIQTLFTDLPFEFSKNRHPALLAELTRAVAEIHTPSPADLGPQWQMWRRHPSRSRVSFIRGGPGNGKSTVTQFLCQIQRAALLDASSEMPVPTKVRDLTKDIKERAEHSGYWPLSPRVPVHVELRLYAQWYGEQSEGSARGVLSYLAARLQKDLEQPVLVGTLKRAFAKERWLFVFDGLDEVPGDVKDRLAGEMRKFSDETLFECRADALIICTSRPQGYSGQFDELRPTIVDLVKLSPNEALACADPVLMIDRSKEEIEQYRSTLREAIMSPSIREIMTTPLQTHIMAVVVRDGGRPPERRWQLFSNFYQVIKKREANRNLADPKIARLLREGDKLIKALHNRLGFELHYRAEKSTGAQTSITRLDLKAIISEIVHSLQDDDIEGTIALLDEATTERLVLVNTPENGDAVRFDIRPLQEFFAAEYMYESANEKGFLDRLRSIAPDSHWREVMHFLISALVEQARHGELAQAIEVLSELDDNPLDQRRALARRLCVGGIISIRLLREGVIESDKRTRAYFRKCLQALLASTDARSLLVSSPPPHSANWLTTIALDAISETAPCENIGAACILPLLLKDSSPQIESAGANLLNCDKGYLDIFLEDIWGITNIDKNKGAPIWVLAALLRRILAENWRELGKETLDRIYNVLQENEIGLSNAAKKCGISADLAEKLNVFFTVDDSSARNIESVTSKVIGGLLVEGFQEQKSEISDFMANIEIQEKYLKIGGVLRSCAVLTIAAFRPTVESIQKLEEIFYSANELKLLPPRFRGELIIESGTIDSNTPIKKLVKHENFGYKNFDLVRKIDSDLVWPELLLEIPGLGLMDLRRLGIEGLYESWEKWISIESNFGNYVEILESNGRLERISLADLGELVARFPVYSTRIKRMFARSMNIAPRMFRESSGKPFEFWLPADADLLPHLVTHLIGSRGRLFDLSRFEHAAEISYHDHARLYLPDVAAVNAVWQGTIHSKEIIAAAGALLLVVSPLPTVEMDGTQFYKRLLSLYDSAYSSWFMPAVLKFLTTAVNSGNELALDFADKLLSRARADLAGRKACEDVVAAWREVSHAPVHATLPSGIWLAQS